MNDRTNNPKNLSNFVRADEYARAHQPTPKPTDQCSYAGNPSYTGSASHECTIADRISCPDFNNPEIYPNCTFAKREQRYKEEGIKK